MVGLKLDIISTVSLAISLLMVRVMKATTSYKGTRPKSCSEALLEFAIDIQHRIIKIMIRYRFITEGRSVFTCDAKVTNTITGATEATTYTKS